VVGTMAGVATAIAIVGMGTLHHGLGSSRVAVLVAACAGLFFDSFLGATVERWGWVGNDLVNFASTLFSAAVAVGLRSTMR
jgi:uncharacterized membrane protein